MLKQATLLLVVALCSHSNAWDYWGTWRGTHRSFNGLDAWWNDGHPAPASTASSAPVDSSPAKTDEPAKKTEDSPVASVPTEEELRAMVAEELKKLMPVETTSAPGPALPPWSMWASKWSDSDSKDDSKAPWMYWVKKYADDKGVPGLTVVYDKTANSVYPSQIKQTTKN